MANTLNLEIDGRPVQVEPGTTVLQAANRIGIYVPHFCYHKKLSIAANCRMCLVEVAKAPKPLPACATPAAEGMKVFTRSPVAKKAQNGVMEFLLINHPLDCPICDQGGECQLQDLSVGYGYSASRFVEPKRVVTPKNFGPLVEAADMTRCIYCTRCIRFCEEIAGVMEIGQVNRSEHVEIVTFTGRTVDNELSGNVIDLCPVGALVSKPFRYSARTWELVRRKSISPHDGLGSNLVVQVKQNRVKRVLPLENEAVNECWLSDRERFSYEALNSEQRLARPRVRRDGAWHEVEWQVALEQVAGALKAIPVDELGALASPHATLEELYLLQKLVKGLGGASVDFRLRQSDFSGDAARDGIPWLGMPVAELATLDRVLVVGSFLRKDHPLLANRLRQAAKKGTQISMLHAAADDPAMPVAHRITVAPGDMLGALASIAEGASGAAGAIWASLKSGQKAAVLLGNFAQHHPEAAQLHAQAQALADSLGARLGFLGEAANSVGGYLAECVPGAGGLDARAMLEQPRAGYLLLNLDPELDCADPQRAAAALRGARLVVALSMFEDQASEYAHVQLPIAPFTETPGTFVSTEGRVQSFAAAVLPRGEARPAWKVLRVLGTLLGLPGFEYESIEQVRAECLQGRELASMLSNRSAQAPRAARAAASGLQRIADVPIHFADPLARRAPSLQQTRDAQPPRAWMNAQLLGRLGLEPGQAVRIRQGAGEAQLVAALDEALPADCVRLAAAHPSTARLGAMFGALQVDKPGAGRGA